MLNTIQFSGICIHPICVHRLGNGGGGGFRKDYLREMEIEKTLILNPHR